MAIKTINGVYRTGLSYAGVSLLSPTQEVIDQVESLSTLDLIPEFDTNSWQNNLDHLLIRCPDLAPDKLQLSVLHWPTQAARFAYGHFLIDGNMRDVISPLAFSSTGPTAQLLNMGVQMTDPSDMTNAVPGLAVNMYALPIRKVLGTPSGNSLYLLTLVDARYFWWQKYANITVNPGVTTWDDLITQIATGLGVIVSPATINANYQKPSSRFNADGQPLPLLMDAVCFQIGQRFIANLDGTFTTQNYSDALTVANTLPQSSNWNLKSGGAFSSTELTQSVPESVTVMFSRTDSGVSNTTPYADQVTLTSLAIPAFSGVTGYDGSKVIVADLTATFTLPSDTTPTNNAAVTAVANQTATDWYNWQLGRVSVTYWNFLPVTMSGLYDFVEWSYKFADTQDISGVHTRIQRTTFNDRISGKTLGVSSSDPAVQYDYLVKITSAVAGANGYYDAEYVILDQPSNTWISGIACYAIDENELPLVQGSIYTGHFVADNPTDELPIFAVRTPDATVLVTNSTLNADGYYEGEIQVFNSSTGQFSDGGVPCYLSETNEFNVIDGRVYNGRFASTFNPTHTDTLSYTQPAVNANVTITVTSPPPWLMVGLRIYISPEGGYYKIISLAGSLLTIENLGTDGNSAVSSTVTATDIVPANPIPILALQMIGIRAELNGSSPVNPQTLLNFIEGTNVTITVAGDPVDDKIDVTIENTYALTNDTVNGGGTPIISVSDVNHQSFDYTYFTLTDLGGGHVKFSLIPSAVYTLTNKTAFFASSPTTPITPVTEQQFYEAQFALTDLGGGKVGIKIIPSSIYPTCTLPLAIAAGNISITNQNQDTTTPNLAVLWNNVTDDPTKVPQWTNGPQVKFIIVGKASNFNGYIQFFNSTNSNDVAINAPDPDSVYTLSLPDSEPATSFQKFGLNFTKTAAGNPYAEWVYTYLQTITITSPGLFPTTAGQIEWDEDISLADDLFVIRQATANNGIPIIDLLNATNYTILQPSITSGARPGWTLTPQVKGPMTIGISSTQTGELKLANSSNTNLVSIVSGVTGTAATRYILPAAIATAGQVLSADTVVGADVTLKWITNSALSNPMTTLGDIIYGGDTPAGTPTRLAGNTNSSIKTYLQSTASGGFALAPTFSQVDLTSGVTGDLPITNGGTGNHYSSVTNGQLLVGNATNGNFDLGTLGAGAGISVSYATGVWTISATGGSGTVTSFSSGNIGSIITASVATATTTPALSFSIATQSANTVWAGPTSGGAAAPTFRALVSADLPTITLSGDVTGATTATTVGKINGATLGTTTATDKNILVANGTQWQSVSMSGDATISNTGVVTIANGAVTNAKLANSSITIFGSAVSLGGTATYPVVILQDQEASGTNGGTATAAGWRTRVLNTEVFDNGNICTLAANAFSLPAGTYTAIVCAPVFAVDRHQCRLANTSDSIYYYGTSTRASNANQESGESWVMAAFTITASKNFEVQHYVGTTQANTGFGLPANTGAIEVYTQVTITKIA